MPNIEFWDLNDGLIVDQFKNRTFVLELIQNLYLDGPEADRGSGAKCVANTEIGSEMGSEMGSKMGSKMSLDSQNPQLKNKLRTWI